MNIVCYNLYSNNDNHFAIGVTFIYICKKLTAYVNLRLAMIFNLYNELINALFRIHVSE